MKKTLAAFLLLAGPALAGVPAPTPSVGTLADLPVVTMKPYDEGADADAAVAAAFARARAAHKRVLIDLGGNWCPDCLVLANLMLSSAGTDQKIPHIGWNGLLRAEGAQWQNTLLGGTTQGETVYFVHSFQAVPEKPEHCLANCNYGGHDIPAVIRAGNVVGCQFHPEKSGKAGLEILARFCGH